MKIYIELSSLEEGSEALEALRMYKEAGMGGVLFQRKEEEKPAPKAEEPKEAKPEEPKKEEPIEEPDPVYPSLTEVREAVKSLQDAFGKEETKKLLAEFGAKGASSVKEEDRKAFLQKAEAMING